MNVVFSALRADSSMPWFEEPGDVSKYKVYHDGSHYVASVVSAQPSKVKIPAIKSAVDYELDRLYGEAVKAGFNDAELHKYIKDGILEYYPEYPNVDTYVSEGIERQKHNFWQRVKRFRRKAMLHPWNYFVTFTYDDKRETAKSFRQKLGKCLSNLAVRRGWRYMGVFETAPLTGRLHFHGLLFVPEGQMVGYITEKSDYSTKQHKMQITHSNSFFAARFGRNDFKSISESELRYGSVMQYLLKYLEKSGEKILYSRGLPSDFVAELPETAIAAEMFDFVTKYILFDDVIDYAVDVLNKKDFICAVDICDIPPS